MYTVIIYHNFNFWHFTSLHFGDPHFLFIGELLHQICWLQSSFSGELSEKSKVINWL